MQFSILRNRLLDDMSIAAKAISPHSPVPAMAGIMFEVKDNALVLTGHSQEMTIRTQITPGETNLLKIDSTGGAVVEAKYLIDLLRQMSGDMITMTLIDNAVVQVSSKDGDFILKAHPLSAISDIDLRQPETRVELPAGMLLKASEQVAYAASLKDSRIMLMGVNLMMKDKQFQAAATDSFRLARYLEPCQSDQTFNLTIPTQALNEVVRTIDKDKPVTMYLDRRKVQFISGPIFIQAQLYEGSFPDVSRIIPKESVSTLEVSARELEGILRRATVYTNSQSSSTSPVRLTLSEDHGDIDVISAEIGSCEQVIEDYKYSGPSLVLACNAKLILDAVKGLKAEKILFSFTGEQTPFAMTSMEDDTVTMVVVPIRAH